MLEQNSTFWSGGVLDGKKEMFLTPGLLLGGFQIAERLQLSFGAGVQIAAIADPDPARRQAATHDHPAARIEADAASAITAPAVNAVVIATRHDTHGPLVKAALQAGIRCVRWHGQSEEFLLTTPSSKK